MAGQCKLNVTVKSVTIHSNDMPPVPLTADEISRLSNAITATVLWPSGNQNAVIGAVAPVLVSPTNTDITFDFDLVHRDGVYPPDPQHPGARLYRYLVLDDTDGQGSTMYLSVTSTMKADFLTTVFASVLSGLLGGAAELVPGGQLVNGAVSGAAVAAGDWLAKKLTDDGVVLIGKASTLLHAGALLQAGVQNLTLDLITGPKDSPPQKWIIPGQWNPDGSPVWSPYTVLVPANIVNGSVTLLLEAFPV